MRRNLREQKYTCCLFMCDIQKPNASRALGQFPPKREDPQFLLYYIRESTYIEEQKKADVSRKLVSFYLPLPCITSFTGRNIRWPRRLLCGFETRCKTELLRYYIYI